jgi:hypothetical protein
MGALIFPFMKIQHSSLIEGHVKRHGLAYLKQSNYPTGLIAFSAFVKKELIDSRETVAVFTVRKIINQRPLLLFSCSGDAPFRNINSIEQNTNTMKLTESDKYFLKGYAEAIQDMLYKLTCENTCAKSYDPIDFDKTTIHSYAFNLKDGGRHHPLSDYESVQEVCNLMVTEAEEIIKEHYTELAIAAAKYGFKY